jgi:hypothetical protein
MPIIGVPHAATLVSRMAATAIPGAFMAINFFRLRPQESATRRVSQRIRENATQALSRGIQTFCRVMS